MKPSPSFVSTSKLRRLIAAGERSIRTGLADNDYKMVVACLKELLRRRQEEERAS